MSKLPKSDLNCYWSATAAQNLRARKPSVPYAISPRVIMLYLESRRCYDQLLMPFKG